MHRVILALLAITLALSIASVARAQSLLDNSVDVAVQASPNPVDIYHPVSITITVSPSAKKLIIAPSGTVDLYYGEKWIDNAILTAVGQSKIGVCSVACFTNNVGWLSKGPVHIGASFNSENDFYDDNSGSTDVSVIQNTVLDASPTVTVVGNTVTFTATFPNWNYPSGWVSFYKDWDTEPFGRVQVNSVTNSARLQVSDLTADTHNVWAYFEGGTSSIIGTIPASHSNVRQVTVNSPAKHTPTVTISPSSAERSIGQPVTFTATVSSPYDTPKNTVSFVCASSPRIQDASALPNSYNIWLNNGQASWTYDGTVLSTGTYYLWVRYNGDNNFNADTSSNYCTFKVDKALTQVSVAPTSGNKGATVQLAATLIRTTDNAPLPNKQIAFQVDGVYVPNSPTMTGTDGTARCTYTIPSALATGQHTVRASFGENSDYLSSNASGTLTVSPAAAAATKIVVDPATGVPGQATTLVAYLELASSSSGVTSQQIAFKVDGNAVPNSPVYTGADGAARCTYTVPPNMPTGPHAIIASFTATADYQTSSGSGTLTVNATPPTATRLVVDDEGGSPGQSITLVAVLERLSNYSGVPNEQIVFQVDGVPVPNPPSTGINGNALCSYTIPSTLAIGAHTIYARFVGDTGYGESHNTATLTVSMPPPAATNIVVAPVTGAQGEMIDLIAYLAQSDNNVPVPYRQIAFQVDDVIVPNSPASTDPNGTARCAYSIPATMVTGSHKISASFAGDTTYATSGNSGTLTVTTPPPAETYLVVDPASGIAGHVIALVAHLKLSSDNSGVPSKQIAFEVDGEAVPNSPATTGSDGTASCSYTIPTTMAPGTHTVSASFVGDSSFVYSDNSNILTVSSPPAAPTAVFVSASSGAPGQTTTLVAYLGLTSGWPGVPGKQIEFLVDGTTVANSPVTTGADGTARCAFAIPSTMVGGPHAITASFAGDPGYLGSGGSGVLTVVHPGTAMAWGDNFWGDLGDGTNADRSTPVQVVGLTGVISVAGGGAASFALTSDGTVWAWGLNDRGQLGDGTTTNRSTPVAVVGLTGGSAIASGAFHRLALKSDGTVWAWGDNNCGQLGDGTTTDRLKPVQVLGLTGVTAVAGGGYASLALKSDGTVWTWGSNWYGQIGDGTASDRWTPEELVGVTGMAAIASGEGHCLALRSDGTVWAWGMNPCGELGDGTTTDRLTPVQVPGLAGVVAIAAGSNHSLALKADGTVWAWGANNCGQIGDGTTTERWTPTQITGLTAISSVACATEDSLALKSDGTVWTWGLNYYGELGDGTTADRHTPVLVGGLADVEAIAGADTSTLAVISLAGTALSVSPVSGKVGQTVTLNAMLTTGGTALPNKTVQFSVGGTSAGSNATNDSGVAQVDYKIPGGSVGSQSITATFPSGDPDYNGTSNTGTLTVGKANTSLSVTNLSGSVGQTVKVSATLTRTTDNGPLSGKTVQFTVGSSSAGSASTNGSGVAQVDYKIPEGSVPSQTITATFPNGDPDYNGTSNTGTLTVSKGNVSFSQYLATGVHGDVVTLKTLVYSGGSPASGRTVAFTVEGDSTFHGSGTSDANGVASCGYTIPVDMPIGLRSVTVSFAGNGSYNAATRTSAALNVKAKVSFSLYAATGTPGQTVLLKTLVYSGGVPASNLTIMFYVDSNLAGAPTPSYALVGSALSTATDARLSWTIPASMPAGQHNVMVSFAGNSTYAAASRTTTALTVGAPKANVSFSLYAVSGAPGQSVTLRTLVYSGGTAAYPLPIVFKVEGDSTFTGTGTSDASGASCPYTIPLSLPKGPRNVTVSTVGDPTHNAAARTTVALTVK